MTISKNIKSTHVHSGIIAKMASFGRKKDGVVSIEAALLFPFMILLFIGMIDITSLISAKRKITVAASAVIDLTTQETANVTKAELNEFMRAADAILEPRPASDTSVDIIAFRPNGGAGGSVNEEWSHSRGSCGGAPAGLTGSALGDLTAQGNDILVSRVCINFTPIVGYVMGLGTFKVEEYVAQRPRQGLTIECTNC